MPARMEARFHQINCDLSHFFLAILSLYLTILHFSSLNYEVISQFVLFSLYCKIKSQDCVKKIASLYLAVLTFFLRIMRNKLAIVCKKYNFLFLCFFYYYYYYLILWQNRLPITSVKRVFT